MRTLIAILATLLLCVPAAAAGAVNANATVLEDEEGCREWSRHDWDSWEGNRSSGWWAMSEEGQACRGDTTFAEADASDDEGTLARVAVESWNHNSSSMRHEESAYQYEDEGRSGHSYYYSYAYEESQGWGHAVTVETTAGSAKAGRECTSTYARQGYDSWSYSTGEHGDYSSHHGSGSDTSEDGCRAGVTATHAGRDAGAHVVDGCAYGSEGRDSGHYASHHYEYSGADACRYGAESNAAGESGFAGLTSTCRWQGDGWEYEDERSEESASSEWSECTRGVTVDQSTGPHAWAGYESTSYRDCRSMNGNETCEAGDWGRIALQADWERSPVGPVHEDYTILYLP